MSEDADVNPEPSDTEVRPEDEATAGAAPELAPTLETMRAERDDLRDQLQRAQAELVNFSGRMRREREADRRYKNEHLLRDLLPILDNFERALHVGSDAPEVKPVVAGIRLAQREIFRVLEQHGVKPFECAGQPFDPSRQEVLETVVDESLPDKQVVATLRRGYLYQDRVLQVARVRLAVHAVAAAPEAPPEE